MIILFTFCDIPWWLTWLLPFILGLALGWLMWSRFKTLFNQSQSELTQSQQKLADLYIEHEHLHRKYGLLEGDLALCRGRIREIELSGKSAGSASLVTKSTAMATSAPVDRWATAVGSDQLQIIEGIGPKMEAILKENKLPDFASLAASSGDHVRSILNQYGDKYRIIDPTTWPQQAALARDGKFNELMALQKSLDGGRSDSPAGQSDSKLEKFLIKAGVLKKWKQDDLKAVEGIGPKIEGLLHAAGITTWKQLSEIQESVLQEILEKAGPRYQLADPQTWPKQAGMAASGLWEELQNYQDALNGGRETS